MSRIGMFGWDVEYEFTPGHQAAITILWMNGYFIGAKWRHMVSNILVVFVAGNGLSSIRRQTITWTNADYCQLWINFSEIWIEYGSFFSSKLIWKSHLKDASYFGQEPESYHQSLLFFIMPAHCFNCVIKCTVTGDLYGEWQLLQQFSPQIPWQISALTRYYEYLTLLIYFGLNKIAFLCRRLSHLDAISVQAFRNWWLRW